MADTPTNEIVARTRRLCKAAKPGPALEGQSAQDYYQRIAGAQRDLRDALPALLTELADALEKSERERDVARDNLVQFQVDYNEISVEAAAIADAVISNATGVWDCACSNLEGGHGHAADCPVSLRAEAQYVFDEVAVLRRGKAEAETERDKFRAAVETVAKVVTACPGQWDFVIGDDGRGGSLPKDVKAWVERAEDLANMLELSKATAKAASNNTELADKLVEVWRGRAETAEAEVERLRKMNALGITEQDIAETMPERDHD